MTSLLFKIRKLLLDEKFFLKPVKPFLYFMYRLIQLLYGSSIPLNTKFVSTPIFPHGLYGIFISGDAIIGDNVTIYHQVTIGSNYSHMSKYKGAPIIGDNVTLGAGSKIIGGIKIGKNVKVGTNCSVNHSVNDNLTVVMPRPRIIDKVKYDKKNI